MRLVCLVCAVGVIAALSAGSVAAASHQTGCTPTVNSGGGPGRGTPPMRAKIGKGHVLTGVVLSSSTCAPIAHALVSFWQSNAKGVYTPAGSGAVSTTRAGRFRFEGPRPKGYYGRPGHIHIKVEAPGFEPLYTEYEPRGATRGNVRLVLFPSDL
jgi:protocatechuate 3,4-dioxygenase beta subunit